MAGEIWISLGHGLASMALAAVSYGLLMRAPLSKSTRSSVMGLAFGLAACLMMASPIQIAEGTFTDGRFVMVSLAGLFGGLPAALVSVAIAAIYRLQIGGHGMTMGILSMVFGAGLGLAWRQRFKKPDDQDWKSLGLFGALLTVHIFSIGLIPIPDASRIMLFTWLASLPLYIAAAVACGSMMLRESRLINHEKELKRLNNTDHLTGLANRRFFNKATEAALRNTEDGESSFAILMIDIDHFKRVNDTYGHDAGDRALTAVATVLRSATSRCDVVARYGGEEFAVFLRYATPNQALLKADFIRKAIQSLPIDLDGAVITLTVSIGMTASRGGNNSAEFIINQADEALYEAKRSGRNRVEADKSFTDASAKKSGEWALAA